MKSLVIVALAMMITVSGCSGKQKGPVEQSNPCKQSEISERGIIAEGGATWSGDAEEGATVQFSTASGIVPIEPNFSFHIPRGATARDAAKEMSRAYNEQTSSRCAAKPHGAVVTLYCGVGATDELYFIQVLPDRPGEVPSSFMAFGAKSPHYISRSQTPRPTELGVKKN